MENLILSFNVVAPTFVIILLGCFIKRMKLASDEFFAVGNKLSFSILIPVLLFNGIYKTDIKTLLDPKLIIFVISALLILFLVLCVIVPRVVKDRAQRGVIIQGIFRSNFVIFGVSITTNMFGAENSAVAGMLSAFLVPLYNLLAVVGLGLFTGSEINVKKILKGIVTNPLIIASVIGVIVAVSGITLPVFAQNSIGQVAAIATPFALIVMGGEFNFNGVREKLPQALSVVFFKLVVSPAVFLPFAVLLGFRDQVLVVCMIAFASPTAVSSYIMAKNANADHELASQIVVYTSSFCILTIFLWVFVLKTMGLI